MPPNAQKMLKELGVEEWPEVARKELVEADQDINEAKLAIKDAADDFKEVLKLVNATDQIPFEPKGRKVQGVFALVKKYKVSMNDLLKAYEKGGWQETIEKKIPSPDAAKVMKELEAADWPNKAIKILKDAEQEKRDAQDTIKEVDADVKNVTKLVGDTAPLTLAKDPNVVKVMTLAKRYKIASGDVIKAYEKGGWEFMKG